MEHVTSSVEVYVTGDYARFKMLTGNRQLNEKKIKNILSDIENGVDVLKYYPIQVNENAGRLEIIDGQHRFYISRKLKRAVYYILMEEKRQLHDIAKINSNTEKWNSKDFINCYVQQGNVSYTQLQQFMDKYGFTITVSQKLLANGNPGTESGGDNHDFQRGLFKVNYLEEAERIAEECKRYSQFKYWKD